MEHPIILSIFLFLFFIFFCFLLRGLKNIFVKTFPSSFKKGAFKEAKKNE